MIDLLIDSPCPCHPPWFVKNGSNRRAKVVVFRPGPLSAIDTRMSACSMRRSNEQPARLIVRVVRGHRLDTVKCQIENDLSDLDRSPETKR